VLEEFTCSTEELERARKHNTLASTLKVDMHEVIGHASGRINDGIGTPKETLKSCASALEEGRADLVALWYVMDGKLVELGLMESLEVGKAAYDAYIRSGLVTQLQRLAPGEQIEESHMRNRQMVSAWAFEKGKAANVIERVEKDGKTCFRINDHDRLRQLFGELLREIQRIKSEGDFEAGKRLVEDYGVKVDRKLHDEVLARFAHLGTKPYSGFIQPELVPVMEGSEIVDVRIVYPEDFLAQQLDYGTKYSFLPHVN
jgi:dipeptidyl-peptidase-3